MRLLKINLLAMALVLFSVSLASAYSLRLEENSGNFDNAAVNDVITVDVFLDTEGESDIVLLGIGVQTDRNLLTYAGSPDNVLPTPGILLDFGTFTWLAPTPAWGGEFPGTPVDISRVTVDFAAASFTPTTATGDNVLLATLSYTVLQAGSQRNNFAFDFYDTGTFELSGGNTINEQVNVLNNVVPEPTTALLVGIGMVGLGVAGRRRQG